MTTGEETGPGGGLYLFIFVDRNSTNIPAHGLIIVL